MTSNFLEPPKGYDIKEISIAKDHEIIVLLRDKQCGKSIDKSHYILGSVDLSNIKQGICIPFQDNAALKDDIQVIYIIYISIYLINFIID